MPRWEYHIEYLSTLEVKVKDHAKSPASRYESVQPVDDDYKAVYERKLCDLGAEGWEMCGNIILGDHEWGGSTTAFIFKREITTSS